MAYNKAWIVDHGPARLHRNEPMDIVTSPPQSRVRRKVDQFRTLASRAASRWSDLRARLGNDIKDMKFKPARHPQPPQSPNKRTFTSYGQEDIFINPFGASITPERNFHGTEVTNDLGSAPILAPDDDIYQKIDDGESRPSIREVAMNIMGVHRHRRSASDSDESSFEYERELEPNFEASEVTTNYYSLYYLARTKRSAMFSAMWRHHRDSHPDSDILHQACRRGHNELVSALIERHIDINALDDKETSALFYAVDCGYTDCATLLVKNGAVAEVGKELEPGMSVLHTAARKGDLRVTQVLLKEDRWVDVNSTGEFDYTALHVAADAGHRDVINCLLDNGASIDALTKSDRTAFEICMHNDKLSIAKLLLERGSNIERFDGYGRSILHWAAGSATPHVVRFLLDNSASPHLANKAGMMPHHVAARHGRAANLHILLTRGAPLNAPHSASTDPKVALLDALDTKKYACVAILLMHGAKTARDGADPADLLLRVANTFAHDPSHFGGHLIEAFLYSGHVRNMLRASRDVFRKMALYADMEAWYRQLVPRPPSLRNMCRVMVRHTLIRNAYGTSIMADVRKLDLPDALLDFLLMKECDIDGVLDSVEAKST